MVWISNQSSRAIRVDYEGSSDKEGWYTIESKRNETKALNNWPARSGVAAMITIEVLHDQKLIVKRMVYGDSFITVYDEVFFIEMKEFEDHGNEPRRRTRDDDENVVVL